MNSDYRAWIGLRIMKKVGLQRKLNILSKQLFQIAADNDTSLATSSIVTMPSSPILALSILSLATLGLSYPSPFPRACTNTSFVLTNPLFGEWGQGKYAQIVNGGNVGQAGAFVSYFTTNVSSAAQVYAIEATTGRWFFTDPQGDKYFAWSDEFE
ncbi:hypothetical protein M409DRAFT_22062 [Zasmidium cellare ATCC 36951]|uniref:Uncharacterized protein n=1 Tax=Zasmidium cellare ATCC 36951 TaxID=1080233 RepID=A0A6A6CR07_ZASCE|nr:uncharacterized protein M409DRAFT_22062 [Zasmidium cellare ATCC 36951]KAF2167916.1 hypothetical protein M409DRAFT_22062 [Zasmidium cellare ATCC 36951]